MTSESTPRSAGKVTLADVAKAAGVSTATVSFVLNDKSHVRAKTRQRVLKVVEELGYRTNMAAKTLRTGRSPLIGLIVPSLSSPFFAELAEMIIHEARMRGSIVCVIDTQDSIEREREGLDYFCQHNVEGIIWCAPRLAEKKIDRYRANIPIVVFDRDLGEFDSVIVDDEAGGRLIGDYILSQGHTRIGHLSGPLVLDSAKARRRGLREACRGRGQIVCEAEADFTENVDQESVRQMLAHDVTVIVAGNDMMAVGVIMLLHEDGVSVPDQISVVGYDDTNLCKMVSPALTSVRQSRELIANRLISMLMRRTQGDFAAVEHVKFGVELKIRDSVILRASAVNLV